MDNILYHHHQFKIEKKKQNLCGSNCKGLAFAIWVKIFEFFLLHNETRTAFNS